MFVGCQTLEIFLRILYLFYKLLGPTYSIHTFLVDYINKINHAGVD